MKTNIILLCIAFLWNTSLFGQQTREYVFSPDSVHIFNLPNPVNSYYLPYNVTGILKPLFAEPFTTNASLPNSSQDIVATSGDIKNTFFGGDQPDGLGWGFTSTTLIINEVFSKNDFPIILEGEFFNRDSYGGYNESYFWIGNRDYEHYNPSTSILPTPNVQEGVLIGGLPERTVVINGRNSVLPSEFFLNSTHNLANYSNWFSLKTMVDITEDGRLIICSVTMNNKCVISEPIIISQPDFLTLDNFRLGICVDDLARKFKVTRNARQIDLIDLLVCQNEIFNLENLLLNNLCLDFEYLWDLPGSNILISNDMIPKNVKYTMPGTYNGSVVVKNGQISLTGNFKIIVEESLKNAFSLQLCSGDSTYFNNQWIKNSGNYTQTLQAQNGCDSITTLVIEVLENYSELIEASICAGDSIAFNNQWIKDAGQYLKHQQSSNGCDSLQVLDVKIMQSIHIDETESICDGDSIYFKGKWLFNDGQYEYRINNQSGCDSIFLLTLNVKQSYVQFDSINTNSAYTWFVNGKNYTESGIYQEIFEGLNNCDSVRILVLNIIEDDIVTFPNILKPGSESNGYFTGFSNSEQGEFLEISVYDRWGNLVFQNFHFLANQPKLGWDGKFKNRPVVQGVYVYLAKYRHANGNVTSFKGDITIVH